MLVRMTTQAPNPSTSSVPDPRPLLLRACEVADTLMSTVAATDLDRPTPCTEFEVRDLLGHLVMVARRVRVVLGGGSFADVPQVIEIADDELVTAWQSSVADLRAALPHIDLSAMVTAPFGTVPAFAAVASYAGEVAVHCWDLAVAIGRTDLLDRALAVPLLEAALQRLPREGREHLPFGDVVDVPDDRSAYDRLVGWMGRDPAWRAPVAGHAGM